MSEQGGTENDHEWARRIGLGGQADQSEESVKQIARVAGIYYRALIAECVPKRLAAELTFAYQQAVYAITIAALDREARQR